MCWDFPGVPGPGRAVPACISSVVAWGNSGDTVTYSEVSGGGNITVADGTLAGTSGNPSEIVGGGKIESTGGAINITNEYRLPPEFARMMRVFVFS